jgi:hypothetical protein
MSTPYRLREEPAREMIAAAEAPKALGRLRSVHHTGKTVRRAGLAAGSIALTLAVLAIAWPNAVGFVAIAFVIAAVVAAWVGFAVVLGLDVTVHAYENALVVDRSARRPVRVPYDAIRALYVHRRSEWGLELEDRIVYVPMKVSEDRRLHAVIEQDIEKPVLVEAHRALASAEPLTFGALTLELDGVRHLGDLLPWSDLDFVRITDDAFVFVRKATQHSFVVLSTETVPFPRVLVSLLARRTDVVSDDRFWTRFVTSP